VFFGLNVQVVNPHFGQSTFLFVGGALQQIQVKIIDGTYCRIQQVSKLLLVHDYDYIAQYVLASRDDCQLLCAGGL
jgi:hypothetical protein